jgi:hypothetical protein
MFIEENGRSGMFAPTWFEILFGAFRAQFSMRLIDR